MWTRTLKYKPRCFWVLFFTVKVVITIPKMYLMSGPSGAGKTTFAKRFAKDNGYQYFCIDDFYALINGDERLHEDETDVWLIFFKAIQLAEQHGRNIVIDTNSPTRTKRTEFLDWFPSFEHNLIFVYAPFELCVQNNAGRNRKIPADELREIYDSVEIPSDQTEDKRWNSIYSVENDNNMRFFCSYLRDQKGCAQ